MSTPMTVRDFLAFYREQGPSRADLSVTVATGPEPVTFGPQSDAGRTSDSRSGAQINARTARGSWNRQL